MPEQVPKVAMEPKPTDSPDENLRRSLGTKDSLGAALTKQGRFVEAETLLKQVLEARESLGQRKTDPDMLRTINNFAAALHHQGRFTEAEALHRQVLQADEETLGSEHASTITSMHNLAAVLVDQGKLEEAEELQQRALEMSRKVHGAEMPETLGIMGSLGNISLRQGKYEQAETMCREVLELRQKVLREDHPDIPSAMHNLAAALRKRGRIEEAEELHQREAALLQVNNEKTSILSDSAADPAGRGHYDEIERSLQEKVKTSMQTLGRNNQETQANMRQLGDVLIRNGKYKDAEKIFRDVLVTV